MSKRTSIGRALPAVVVVGLVLAGCTGKDKPETTTSAPTRTATTAPITEEPPDPRQVNTDNAVAAYQNYVEVQNSVAQDYFNGWQDKVMPLVSGDHADWVHWYYTQAAAAGRHQVGANIVRSVTVTEYAEDPTGAEMERIVLRACVDSTDVQSLDTGGNNQLVPGTMGRFTTTITMQHMTVFNEQGGVAEDPHGQAWWRVSVLDRDTGSAC